MEDERFTKSAAVLRISNSRLEMRVLSFDLEYCAAKANEHHKRAVEGWQSSLLHANAAGKHLRTAKRQTRHGNFKGWREQNCPEISERTAQVYMRIAKRWKELEHDPNQQS